ncbi:MAG: hypothetical protein ACSHXF_16705 [Aquaticitalea sp.]
MANLSDNKLNQVLTEVFLDGALADLDAIMAGLPTGSLTDEERASLSAINVENKIFADDVLTEMSGPIGALLPPYVTSAWLQNDLELFGQLDKLMGRVAQLHRRCSDLQRIVGNEAYGSALAVYKMTEMANEAGIPGAKETYDKLKDRFKSQGGKSKPETEMPVTPV